MTAPHVHADRAADALHAIGASRPDARAIASDLVARYQERQRRYHTLEHIEEMLTHLCAAPVSHLAPLLVATWYHDAVYDPVSPSNESDSAALAERALMQAGVDAEVVARIAALVRFTAVHAAPGDDPDAQIFLDADLAILGADPARYRRYARDVRAEFAHVPDDQWCEGRAHLLEAFLGRPRLFASDAFHARLDAPARHNLRDEIDRLRGTHG